ncbi:MAG: PLP-dependent aminotransferase family protein [Chloroflexi bacterium]|nr:PLP-dependent aminotransferase family protein [Chloroflexota bacterium]
MISQTIDFTRGVPAPESFPTEQMAECAAAVLAQGGQTEALQYGKSYGFLPLRAWLAERQGLSTEQVMLSNGSLQFIELLCQTLIQPNETIFVEQPTYDRTLTLLRRHRENVVSIPLESDGPDLDALEAAIQREVPKAFYIISDFQNPTGVTTSQAKREQIAAWAEQFGFWLIEDAPYRQLRYRGSAVPSLFDLAPARTLQLSSFSKLISPGTRVGTLMGDAAVLQQLAQFAEDTYIMPAQLNMAIVNEFCRRGYLEPQIERLKALYQPRLEAICTAVQNYLPATPYVEPDGGFFFSITLPEGVTSTMLRAQAADAGVRCSDGRGFFANPQDGERFLRLPFCALTPAEIDEGVRRLGEVVQAISPELSRV